MCFVRHGETDWNAARRIQGQIDTPLNATGLTQADAVAADLIGTTFTAIYSSDLDRARTTAGIIDRRLGIGVLLRAELRERHYGIFEGLTYEEAEHRHPGIFRRLSRRDPDCDFGNGESLRNLDRRVRDCITSIATQHAGCSVLVVAHGGVLDIAHRLATGKPLTAPRDFTIANASLNWLTCEDGCWRLESWNVPPSRLATAAARDEPGR